MKSNRYYTNKNGYRQHYNPNSPEARKSGFSPVHRDVARKKYGDIKHNQVVHHKDGNKLNNSWNNIELMSRSEHTKYHNNQRNKSNNIGCLSVIAIISLFLLLCTLLLVSL